MEQQMNSTLDSIRPSDNNHPQEDMSYLFGRDPSILAYGQRPCLSNDTKKNLLSFYEVEYTNLGSDNGTIGSESHSLQTVNVYLRLKPFPKKLKLTQEQQDAYKIINSTTLFTRLPTLDNNTSCLKRSNSTDIVCRKYTFTKTFGPETTQLELFEQGIKQQMADFLAGQNSTIMTYGTTNSGKSYTLQGTTTSPGIIPRCLEFVFCNITTKSTASYKPMHHCDVICLDLLERAQELEIKTKLLTFASVDKHQYTNAYKEMQKLLQEESPIRPSQCIDAHYSVWVSFAEIYNEVVYDLLSNECQKKRTPLKLATDSQGRAFIRGLKTVCVNSGSEAYQVLMAGQYNLKVAATALNARSSRSHCIFTIKLLKYYVENDPESVEVSTFAFCDLAGSERLKKTLNIGDRLKEAQNINTSLLVLGRCLKTIHQGQLTKQKVEHVGPFRESKLTRLFQKALSGKEHMALIVNINPLPNLYIETQNVLSFSAIAKKIVIEEKEKLHKKVKSRFSQIVTQSIKTVTDWDDTELEAEADWQSTADENVVSGYIQAGDYEELVSENESLKEEIVSLKSSALTRDLQIRQEMADTYTAMMKELESEWKNRIKDVEEQQEDALQWSVKQVEEFYKQKLSQLNSRKRRRSPFSENNLDDDAKHIEELEMENSRLTSKIVLLKTNMKELKEANELVTVEKNKASFELGLMKEELKSVNGLLSSVQEDICTTEDTKYYVEELKSQLTAKQEQVKKLKIFLNEAKEEYIAITTEMKEKTYIIKEQEEELFEKQETIDDLEAQFGDINICLTDKTKTVEILEEKLENQTKSLMEYENKVQDMQEQIETLKSEKLSLLDEVELLKEEASGVKNTKDTECVEKVLQGCEVLINVDEHEESITQDESLSDIKFVILDETGNADDQSDTETEHKRDPQIEERVIAIDQENSALRERLFQSTTEIQSLKEELECAKVKLKDISVQLIGLKMTSVKPKIDSAQNTQEIATEKVEIGCQVHIQAEEQPTDVTETDVVNKSIQTVECITKEETNQTSFVKETDDEDILDELALLTIKYDEKGMVLEELEKEILSLKGRTEDLAEENNVNKAVIEEYKLSVELLQQELSVIKEHNTHIEQELQKDDGIKVTLETKINDYEQQFNEANKELSVTKDNYSKCMEKLNRLQASFDSNISKCKTEHEKTISDLQTELSGALERSNIKSQCLDVHVAKLTELEHNLEGIPELQHQIEEVNWKLKACREEKERLQKLLDENNDKLLELEDRLENAEEKEQEKDAEICSLQKEMKCMIQQSECNNTSDKLMELEMKSTIKDLTETKEMLSRKLEYIEQLEMRVKSNEQNAKIVDLLQQSAQERQAENERLRGMNEELKNSLVEKEREMEAFMKNRDDMVTKYESLVKSQQEELEKQKRGAMKNQPKEKEYCETNTSEDEVVLKERRTRRPPKKYAYSPRQDDISVIELSGSDSKKNGKRAILPPPLMEPSSERKRNARKKKLYVTENESFQDIEPLESTTTITPMSQARNLRSRRK